MTFPQPDEQGKTAPIELPGHQPPPSPPVSSTEESAASVAPERTAADQLWAPTRPEAGSSTTNPSTTFVARPASAAQQEVMFVPLAVTIGDGFKFGCGFFLALVVASLLGFVLLAALFVLVGLFGLSLPLTR